VCTSRHNPTLRRVRFTTAELDDLPAGQVSGSIAEALRRRRISDTARAALTAAGHRGFR
jgi:predicted RNA binding protein with dsRBD fold (UPF0201 family)